MKSGELSKVAEANAEKIVKTITKCIDSLRSVNGFNPPSIGRAPKSPSPSASVGESSCTKSSFGRINCTNSEIANVGLYEHLELAGVVKDVREIEAGLKSLENLQFQLQDNSSVHTSIGNEGSKGNGTEAVNGAVSAVDTVSIAGRAELDRQKVVHELFLPLLLSLAYCYSILDADAAHDVPDTSNSSIDNSCINDTNKRDNAKKSSRSYQKPPPPKGLLSLANYTDIACLLEMTVCTSIVPHLELNVLPPLTDRIKYQLPKTLAGRIFRKALLWGNVCLSAYATDASDSDSLAHTFPIHGSDEDKQHLPQITKKQRQAIKILHAKKELSNSAIAISKLISLDRFRPMLLPRHVVDLHAVFFQLERLDFLSHKLQTIHTANKSTTNCHLHQQHDQQRLEGEYKTIMKVITTIDLHTKAKAYQSLLFSGSTSPPWLKKRVGSLLTHLATSSRDGIEAIVDVFVLASSSIHGKEITGASARLGRVLCSLPFPKNHLQQPSAYDSSLHYQKLFRQLFKLLSELRLNDREHARKSNIQSSGDNQIFSNDGHSSPSLSMDNRTVSAILTTWAVFDNAPYVIIRDWFLPNLMEGLVQKQMHSPNLSFHTDINALGTQSLDSPVLSPQSSQSTPSPKQRRATAQDVIRFFYALFSFTPPNATHTKGGGVIEKVCRALFSTLPLKMGSNRETLLQNILPPGHISAVSQILRIASAHQDGIFHSQLKTDALLVLRMIVHTVLSKCRFQNESVGDESEYSTESRTIEKIVSVSLMQSIAVNEMDLMGCHFNLESKEWIEGLGVIGEKRAGKQHGEISTSTIENMDDRRDDIISGIEKRSQVVIENIILPLAELHTRPSDDKDLTQPTSPLELMPGAMFRLLLLIYFQSNRGVTQSHGNDGSSKNLSYLPPLLPEHIQGFLNEYKIMSMILLPLLSEKSPPASLLLEDAQQSVSSHCGALHIINMIINGTAQVVSKHFSEFHNSGIGESILKVTFDHKRCSYVGCSITDQSNKNSLVSSNQWICPGTLFVEDSETQLSIVSIVLSLLVAILELGSEKRSCEDEHDLQCLLPSLHALSILGESPSQISIFTSKNNGINSSKAMFTPVTLKAEVADIASHAMVLISARSAMKNPVDTNEAIQTDVSLIDFTAGEICQIEKALMSKQPPIRARGMVNLRHIARGALVDLLKEAKFNSLRTNSLSSNISACKPLIVEMDESAGCIKNIHAHLQIVESMLRIAFISLQDSESYVYLAGIQAAVAIVDACPSHAMPILGYAVSNGKIELFNIAEPTKKRSSVFHLSFMQRIKLTEALIFTIRRRGGAIHNYSSMLMNLMLYRNDIQPTRDSNEFKGTGSVESLIQTKTESYFRCRDLSNEEIGEGDEQHMRVNTGGPVFDSEESGLLRAACINVTSELLSVMQTTASIRYCPVLISLVVDALRLDSDRPVRRAAALLGREIYSCALQEVSYLGASNFDINSKIGSFVMELVSCGEDILQQTIQRCISVDDVDILGKSTCHAVRGKTRLYDPATVARCKEAIEARNVLKEMKVFEAVAHLVSNRAQELHGPKVLTMTGSNCSSSSINIWALS